MQLSTCYNSRRVLQDRRIVSIKVRYKKSYICALSSGDIAGDLGWPWTVNPYVIAMTLSVLERSFPNASPRTVSAAFCQCRSIHALVPKCPLTSAEMSWCRSVLVPKRLGSEVSGYHRWASFGTACRSAVLRCCARHFWKVSWRYDMKYFKKVSWRCKIQGSIFNVLLEDTFTCSCVCLCILHTGITYAYFYQL